VRSGLHSLLFFLERRRDIGSGWRGSGERDDLLEERLSRQL